MINKIMSYNPKSIIFLSYIFLVLVYKLTVNNSAIFFKIKNYSQE